MTKLDVGADPATTSDRVGAYLNAHPDTTAYIETGSLDVSVAHWLKDRGIAPGKVILGGFDVESDVLQEMKSGYIQAHADQQPYMQGFMPVIEVYLAKTVGLAPADIDTGNGIVLPKDAIRSPRWPPRAFDKSLLAAARALELATRPRSEVARARQSRLPAAIKKAPVGLVTKHRGTIASLRSQ